MPRYSRKTSRRRTTRTRATASRARRTSYSARRPARRATRAVSRTRRSSSPRAIKLVIQTTSAPATAVNPLAEPLMKATPSPKKAKF